MSTHFHELIITRVLPTGTDALAVEFAVPGSLAPEFRFLPGQYLTLRATVNGEDIRRSYSICAAPSEQCLRVGIRKVDGGVFSTFAQDLKPGDRLLVMPPQGRFTAEPEPGGDYLLVAAGSGITPVLSIARSLLEGDAGTSVTLLYGNRSTASIMFREELEELKDRFLDRFTLLHVLSREEQDVALMNGRIDAGKLEAMAGSGLIDPKGASAIFLCGPGAMTEEVRRAFEAMGVLPERIRTERFTPADGVPAVPVAQPSGEPPAGGTVVVEAVLDGIRRSFTMDPGRSTVLHAAHEAGIELPYSCAGGMCCTCRCRIVEGAATMDMNYSLEPWEIEAGFTLACQSRPTGDRLVLDFDAS